MVASQFPFIIIVVLPENKKFPRLQSFGVEKVNLIESLVSRFGIIRVPLFIRVVVS